MESQCGFCRDGLIVAPQRLNKLVGRAIKSFNKNKDTYSQNKLKYYTKLSKNLEAYIYTYANELYDGGIMTFSFMQPEIRQQFIDGHIHSIQRSNVGLMMRCDFCNRDTCEHHYIYANIVCFKCDICLKEIFRCGWCTLEKGSINKCSECADLDTLICGVVDISSMMPFDMDEDILEVTSNNKIRYIHL